MTTIADKTPREILDQSNLNELADALKKIKFGRQLSRIKVTFAALTAAAAVDITTAASKAAATISGITLATGENLPPIGVWQALRITASGTAGSLGAYLLADTGATAIVPPGGAGAAVGIAKLSDDGKTITFPNTVTGFVLEYFPRTDVAMNSEFVGAAP
jgi:hypothetical protein